jgi:tetratricopeptide (TPR) repeat protein
MNAFRLQKLKEMEAEKPEDAFLKYAIAIEHVSAGDDEEAKPYFELLLKKFPDYVATYLQFGGLYEREGETGKAIAVYQKGIEVAKQAGDAKAAGELNEALQLAEDE